MRMTGDTIVITGGGSGVGLAPAKRDAACGNRVIIGADEPRRSRREKRRLHGRVQPPHCRVSVELFVQRSILAVMTRLFPLAVLICMALPTRAETPTPLCAAAEKVVRRDTLLAAGVEAAFGKVEFSSAANDCFYPLKLLRYASADVLLVQEGEPGGGCHGCGALLSAYVIQRIGGAFKTVAKFHEFAQVGTFGAVIDTWPIEIAGDDAIAIEGGGTFQGYSSAQIDFFAFHGGALVNLEPDPKVIIEADNLGAMTDASKAISISGSWFFDPTEKTALVVDYKIDAKGATRVERVVWRLQNGKLALARGHLPPEVAEASGG
jgi:hypothetical protein